MSINHVYVLDANVFIESGKKHYALDIAPGFWEGLLIHANKGAILSIDRVKKELEIQDDKIHDWAEKEFDTWFKLSSEQDVIKAYGDIIQWAFDHDFTQDAKTEFAGNNADAWLVAYSYAKGYTLVTHEIYEANRKNKVKIPNVCQEFNVRSINTFQMLRELNIKWPVTSSSPCA
jgi:hypothetical protein